MSDNHGNTPAAWTGTTIALVGFVLAGIGLMIEGHIGIIFWIGMILMPIGVLVGMVMSKAGMGADRSERPRPGRPEKSTAH